MSIKILFSDLDGTLVEHAGGIDEKTLEATKKLIESGIDLVLVSGRHPDLMKPIYKAIGLKTPVIGCNGGIIKDLNTGEVLYYNRVSEEVVRKSIDIARELEIDWVVYEKNNIFFDKMPPKSYKLPYKNSLLPLELRANFQHIEDECRVFSKDNVLLKVLLLLDNNIKVMEEAKKRLSNIGGVDVISSAKTYIDVMSQGTSKGHAVKMFLEMKGLKLSEAAAIGDAENDIDMLELVGFGIGMGNAVESVKKVVKHTTGEFPFGFTQAVDYLIRKE